MNDFIKVYENTLTQETCETLMRLFDASNCKQIVKNRGTPNFTQLNLNQKTPREYS